METDTKKLHQYILAVQDVVGKTRLVRLIRAVGGTEEVFKADKTRLFSSGLLKDKKEAGDFYDLIHSPIMAEKYDALNSRNNAVLNQCINEKRMEAAEAMSWLIRFTTIDDDDYPAVLRQIYDPPYALFYRGTLPDKNERIIAMVGARRCSSYGKKEAYEISSYLALNGFSIASGMAMGIDGASHRGAMDAGGRSYAFLACGVDVCYPNENRDIFDRIALNGAVISEFPPGTQAVARFFPSRNRLISGISEAVLVMEAKEKSGSLITVDQALSQGRDVYALPSRITDVMGTGCNRLIAQGAGIIRSKETLLEDLNDFKGASKDMILEACPQEINLEKEELLVYSCFDFYARSIEDVQKETGMTLLELLPVVLRLCDKGYLKETFPNSYIRIEKGTLRFKISRMEESSESGESGTEELP